jgi:DNA repair protein REV1
MTKLQLDWILMAYFTGRQVWAYAHGTDDRQVEPPKSRKSVGAECNWGIRFQNDADALAFMDNLAGELSTRMKGGLLSL